MEENPYRSPETEADASSDPRHRRRRSMGVAGRHWAGLFLFTIGLVFSVVPFLGTNFPAWMAFAAMGTLLFGIMLRK